MQTKEDAFQKIKSLVERFDEQIESYRRVDYNETQTCRDFIDSFWKALGWDVDNDGAKDFSPLHSRPLPRGTSRTIGSIVRGFKICVSKQLGHSVWQHDYWEHVIRNDKSHQLIADYILHNPANWENDNFYNE